VPGSDRAACGLRVGPGAHKKAQARRKAACLVPLGTGGYLDHIRVIAGHDAAARGREGPSRPGGEPGDSEAAARRENHDHQCSQRSVESEASSYWLRPARRQLNLNASVINLQFDSDCDS
jgi:hypothetical protein